MTGDLAFPPGKVTEKKLVHLLKSGKVIICQPFFYAMTSFFSHLMRDFCQNCDNHLITVYFSGSERKPGA